MNVLILHVLPPLQEGVESIELIQLRRGQPVVAVQVQVYQGRVRKERSRYGLGIGFGEICRRDPYVIVLQRQGFQLSQRAHFDGEGYENVSVQVQLRQSGGKVAYPGRDARKVVERQVQLLQRESFVEYLHGYRRQGIAVNL